MQQLLLLAFEAGAKISIVTFVGLKKPMIQAIVLFTLNFFQSVHFSKFVW